MTVDFDPTIFSIGPLQVRWYGLMYVIGFMNGNFLLRYLSKKGFLKVDPEKADGLVTYLIIGMFFGARLFYVFIYNWDYYASRPLEWLAVWQGGLSFHGAIVGLVLGAWVFARKYQIPLFQVTDSMALAGTQGLFFGRLGNFINGELYGRVTDSPLGMIFPQGGPYPRHPSQLYEGVFEGIVLGAIIWLVYPRVKRYGVLTPLFIVGYGVFRYFIEFFRQPDEQLGFYFGGTTTMGQILCFIMIIVGTGVYFLGRKKNLPIS